MRYLRHCHICTFFCVSCFGKHFVFFVLNILESDDEVAILYPMRANNLQRLVTKYLFKIHFSHCYSYTEFVLSMIYLILIHFLSLHGNSWSILLATLARGVRRKEKKTNKQKIEFGVKCLHLKSNVEFSVFL